MESKGFSWGWSWKVSSASCAICQKLPVSDVESHVGIFSNSSIQVLARDYRTVPAFNVDFSLPVQVRLWTLQCPTRGPTASKLGRYRASRAGGLLEHSPNLTESLPASFPFSATRQTWASGTGTHKGHHPKSNQVKPL